jgi:protein-tyrosine phosphatase
MSLNLFAPKPIVFADGVIQDESNNSRWIALSGVRNFRDLGGYRAFDRRTIRRGLLYRSANLHNLTDKDLQRLDRLSLKRVVDFRADFEKTSEPDRLPMDSNIQVLEIPILDTSTDVALSLEQQIKAGKVDDINPTKLLIDANIQLATEFTPQYRRFIHEVLAANGQPILFHCTAGKDRTGFAAAILLRILDVPLETVMFDYLLSNQYYFKPLRRNLIIIALAKGLKTARVVAGFLEVKASFLSTAFETINWQYGSFDEYVRQGLGFTQEQVEHLQMLYLQ